MFLYIGGKSIALAHIAYVDWEDHDGRVGIYLALPYQDGGVEGAELIVSIPADSPATIKLRKYLDTMTIQFETDRHDTTGVYDDNRGLLDHSA